MLSVFELLILICHSARKFTNFSSKFKTKLHKSLFYLTLIFNFAGK